MFVHALRNQAAVSSCNSNNQLDHGCMDQLWETLVPKQALDSKAAAG